MLMLCIGRLDACCQGSAVVCMLVYICIVFVCGGDSNFVWLSLPSCPIGHLRLAYVMWMWAFVEQLFVSVRGEMYVFSVSGYRYSGASVYVRGTVVFSVVGARCGANGLFRFAVWVLRRCRGGTILAIGCIGGCDQIVG